MAQYDPFRIDGQVAVVTGASGGLGRAIVLALANAGADVWINHLGQGDAADAVAQEVLDLGRRSGVIEADVSDPSQVDYLVATVLEEAGQIGVWVNNAGILEEVPVTAISVESWERMLAVNLRSVFLCTRAVLPGMLERGSGSIVNVSSQLGIKGAANAAHYAAAKGGILAFTRSVAREVGDRGVRVNAIAPGPLDTAMNDPYATQVWIATKLTQQVLPRFGKVEEVAATAVFLASPAAALYLGQTLSPNGGGVM